MASAASLQAGFLQAGMVVSTKPTVITVQHPESLSAAEVLSTINALVQTDAPLVVQSLPVSIGTSNRISMIVGLGEIGLAIATQITQALHNLHAAKAAAAAGSVS